MARSESFAKLGVPEPFAEFIQRGAGRPGPVEPRSSRMMRTQADAARCRYTPRMKPICNAIRQRRRCRTGRRADFARRADAEGRRADRRVRHLSPGGAAVHRQADRAGAELRRAGGHRHREHAAAQRAAPAHRRSHRIAGAADRDLGGAQGHLQLAGRSGAGVRCDAGECDSASARRKFGMLFRLQNGCCPRSRDARRAVGICRILASRTAAKPDIPPWGAPRPRCKQVPYCRCYEGAGLRRWRASLRGRRQSGGNSGRFLRSDAEGR